MDAGGADPLEGDEALAALLLLHGAVMNGGIDHAVEVLSPAQVSSALSGYRYFGLGHVAELLQGISMPLTEAQAEKLNKEYGALVPSDSTLMHAFQVKLLASPKAFAPVAA